MEIKYPKKSEAAKRRWKSKAYRDNVINHLKKRVYTKEHRDNIGKALKNRKFSEETLIKMRKPKQKKPIRTPEHNKKISESNKTRSEEKQIKIMEGIVGGFWYGKVKNDSSELYCERWYLVNPRVHAFNEIYNEGKCVVCGEFPTNDTLVGHHIYYEKKACCIHAEDGFYYSNLNIKNKRKQEYRIIGDPDKFVCVCKKCHGKLNSGFENRKKWADIFTNLIEEKWGGFCYIDKEAMAIYTNDDGWINGDEIRATRRWNIQKRKEMNERTKTKENIL